MQVTQCYTAFSPGSRVISLLIFPSRGFRNRKPEESRPRGRFGADSPGASFHGDELVACAQGLHPLARNLRHGHDRLVRHGHRGHGLDALDLPDSFQKGDLRDGLAVVEFRVAGKDHRVLLEIDLRRLFPRPEGFPRVGKGRLVADVACDGFLLAPGKLLEKRLCLIGDAVSPMMFRV